MLFNYPLLPYFAGFTAFTPEVPKLYWDVKSQEQRYFTLCKELHKMIAYADMLTNRLNQITIDFEDAIANLEASVTEQLEAQDQKISAQLSAQNAKVSTDLEALKNYVDTRFDNIAESQLVYDVTTGTYRPSAETMRRLYSALAYSNTGNRALVSAISETQTVAQLAEKSVYNIAWSERDTITIDDQASV